MCFFIWPLCGQTVVLKLEHASESRGGLVKTQMSPTPEILIQ